MIHKANDTNKTVSLSQANPYYILPNTNIKIKQFILNYENLDSTTVIIFIV
ncbi:hypothetical protein NLO413_0075 [Candidatus Neoehrlichia lotoris str. RAC413]|uniref:Uncharacterized protein n=1 Tax=Candidatus Neoehrlichia procyonis str. RAC413 TaxID=1359163 RepID=A0A0F3NP85_9RICK|nr:hypothetical protein NLO413_0075 [Candidatus Neoehrlichia lotoris str. RAC413]